MVGFGVDGGGGWAFGGAFVLLVRLFLGRTKLAFLGCESRSEGPCRPRPNPHPRMQDSAHPIPHASGSQQLAPSHLPTPLGWILPKNHPLKWFSRREGALTPSDAPQVWYTTAVAPSGPRGRITRGVWTAAIPTPGAWVGRTPPVHGYIHQGRRPSPGPNRVRLGHLHGRSGRRTGGARPQGAPRAGGLRRGAGGAALCLTSADIDHRAPISSHGLHMSLGDLNRSRPEALLLERGSSDGLMGVLHPAVRRYRLGLGARGRRASHGPSGRARGP